MDVIQNLLQSEEPLVSLQARLRLLDEDERSQPIVAMREAAWASPLVRSLLSEQATTGEIPHHPYRKWHGVHWVLACLADLGYPNGDQSLQPLFDQEYAWLLSEGHLRSVKTIRGRVRHCASQEGNALFAALTLGMIDERAYLLAERLVKWQWADGGWNCDKKPELV
jgi:hypothetical protein